MKLPGRRKTTGEIDGCSEGGHAENWCDRGGGRNRVRWTEMISCGD